MGELCSTSCQINKNENFEVVYIFVNIVDFFASILQIALFDFIYL